MQFDCGDACAERALLRSYLGFDLLVTPVLISSYWQRPVNHNRNSPLLSTTYDIKNDISINHKHHISGSNGGKKKLKYHQRKKYGK